MQSKYFLQSASLENLSSRRGSPFISSRPQSSQSINSAREPLEQSTPASTPRDDLSAHDQYILHQQRRQKLDSLSDRQETHSPSTLPKPLVSHSRWKRIQANSRNEYIDSNNNNETDEDFTTMRNEDFGTQSISSPRSMLNGGMASNRSSRMSHYPGLDCSFNSTSSAYSRRKKELQTKMW